MADAGGKSKKKGRNMVDCKRYSAEGRQSVNKAMKLYRYLRRGINVAQTEAALARLDTSYKTRARKALRDVGFKSPATDVASL